MRTIIVQPSAESDLFEQWTYIDADNPEAANRFVLRAKETFQLIAEMPSIGIAYVSTNPKLCALRKLPIRGFEQHLIFYVPKEDRVEIARVLHAKRDIGSALEASER